MSSATDTLTPKTERIVIGSGEDVTTHVIATFCLAKTIRTFALMTELAQAAGISDVMAAADGAAQAGEFTDENGQPLISLGFVTRVLAILPRALNSGSPTLYRLLGLIVTSNSKLKKMDEEGEDIDNYILSAGRDIAWTASNDQIFKLVMAAASLLGAETILKNLPALARLLIGRG